MIPGSNLLAQAFTLIRPVPVQLHRVAGSTLNAVGQDVTEDAPPVEVLASVQAVKRSQYQRMGLDYNRRYIQIWSVDDMSDLARGRPGDQITWNGRRHELMNEDDWSQIDQWNSLLAIEIGPEV